MQYSKTVLAISALAVAANAAPYYPVSQDATAQPIAPSAYYPSQYYPQDYYPSYWQARPYYANSFQDSASGSGKTHESLAGAKSENANENANLAKGGEAFGFGAIESDNRNLLANENNIEVANANKNELGVEVANFNANENAAEQEAAALAEVANEDLAYFEDFVENDNINLNDNVNDGDERRGNSNGRGCVRGGACGGYGNN